MQSECISTECIQYSIHYENIWILISKSDKSYLLLKFKIEWSQKEMEDEMLDGISDSMDMSLSKL